MIEAIAKLVRRENLTEDEAASAFAEIMRGDATPVQIAGFIVALRMKGETVDEITGFARTARAIATPIEVEAALLDTCGTGGDGLDDLLGQLVHDGDRLARGGVVERLGLQGQGDAALPPATPCRRRWCRSAACR